MRPRTVGRGVCSDDARDCAKESRERRRRGRRGRVGRSGRDGHGDRGHAGDGTPARGTRGPRPVPILPQARLPGDSNDAQHGAKSEAPGEAVGGIDGDDGGVLPGRAHQAVASLPRARFQRVLHAAAGQAVAVVVEHAEEEARRHGVAHRPRGHPHVGLIGAEHDDRASSRGRHRRRTGDTR